MVEASLVNLAEFGVLTVGVVVALQQLRDLKKTREIELETRQAQLFMQLMNTCTSKEGLENFGVLGRVTWSSYEEWLELRRDDLEYDIAYRWIAGVYDGIGALLREGLLNVRMVALVATHFAIYHWEKHKGVIYDWRKRRNARSYRSEWEYLYNELVKYLEEHPELAP